MNDKKTYKMILTSLMIAFVCVGTMCFQFAVPATSGYINIGDSMIFIASAIFGPVVGMISGGIGSALADVLSGYSHWALFTLIIKGCEGYVAGLIMLKINNKFNVVIGSFVGSVIMVFGYFVFGAIMKGSFVVALDSVPGNIVQGVASICIGAIVVEAMSKRKYFKDKMGIN